MRSRTPGLWWRTGWAPLASVDDRRGPAFFHFTRPTPRAAIHIILTTKPRMPHHREDVIMKATRCLALAAVVSTSLAACGGSKKPEPSDVTVTWSDVKQPIQGFGA